MNKIKLCIIQFCIFLSLAALNSRLPGEEAPNFNIPIKGQKIGTSLHELLEKNNGVILFFYPKDDTPGCTIEAKDFNEYLSDFKDMGIKVIGVSKDSMNSHEKFAAKHNLDLLLISDYNKKISKDYSVLAEGVSKDGKKIDIVNRTTILIGKDKKIHKAWKRVKPIGHAQEVLEYTKKHQ